MDARMGELLQRYKKEMKKDIALSLLSVTTWEYPSEILCCKKGVRVFLEMKEDEETYRDLCELMKEVGR